MGRITADQQWMEMAFTSAKRGTCPRRKVGAVLVDTNGRFMSNGRNGPPRGSPHCIDTPCPGANQESGQGLQLCEAVHAEANSLLQCHSIDDIDTIYCTDSPCVDCTKLLLNTSCKRIVFRREYPHSKSREWWTRAGREWVKYDGTIDTE